MNLLKNMKLSTKTTVIISAMLVVIFVIFISFTISSTGKAIKAGVEDELRSMSKGNALQVQRVMDMTQSTAYNINNYIQKQYNRAEKQSKQPQSAKSSSSIIYKKPISNINFEIENYITENARNAAISSPDVVGVGVMFEPYKFDKNIENYAFYISENDTDGMIKPFGPYSYYSKQEYYAKAAHEKDMVFTKPYKFNGIIMVTAATPIIRNNELNGVIMSDFNVLNLSRLDSKNERYPSLYTTIFDQNGVLIYDSQIRGDIGKNMSEFYNTDEWEQATNKMKNGIAFSLKMTNEKGEKEIGFFYPIKAGNSYWWSLLEVENKDINKKINATILGLLIIFIIALVIIVIAINVVLRKMLNPIQSVMQAATDISNGNFDIDIPISSKDEVGQLSSSFVEMAEKIKSVQNQLILKNLQLEETIDKLNKSDAANLAKNTFVANISHEFRTPITLILSVIQLFQMNMNNSIDDDKASKYLQIMKQNCYRLLRLINNLIDISRIEAGFNQLNLKEVDVVNLVSDIVLSISEYAIEKSITVQFVTEIEEMEVAIDPDKMERILLNLLSNSIKFTPIGGQIITNISKKDSSFIISVKDTGIGIPEEKIGLIFDRFHQVDATHTRMNEGSGIGLSLVKAFIEMQGGTIEVHSELGKGSEFIIELPVIVLNNENSKQLTSLTEDINKNIEKLDIEFSDIYYPLAR